MVAPLAGALGYLFPIASFTIATSDLKMEKQGSGLFWQVYKNIPESWFLAFLTVVAPGLIYIGFKLLIHPSWSGKPDWQMVTGRLLVLIFCISWIVPVGLLIFGVFRYIAFG